MAKNNRGGKRKQRPNYFTQEIQRNGKNFLDRKRSDVLKRDSNRIFRDLANANVDFKKFEEYLSDPVLLEAMIFNAADLCNFHWISQQGAIALVAKNDYMGIQYDREKTIGVGEEHRLKSEAYGIIYNHLIGYKQSKDISSLYPMTKLLWNYRYKI